MNALEEAHRDGPELDGFHFGIFELGAFPPPDGQLIVDRHDRKGHVHCYPADLGIVAIQRACKWRWLEDGEYVVAGVRLRDGWLVVHRVKVSRTTVTRDALRVETHDGDRVARLEGEVVA